MEPSSARLCQYQIKPLSLHQRFHSFDSSLPCNVLKITGPFSVSDAHTWLGFCLPDVPEVPPAGDIVTLQYKSSFTGTQLLCSYRLETYTEIYRDIQEYMYTLHILYMCILCIILIQQTRHFCPKFIPSFDTRMSREFVITILHCNVQYMYTGKYNVCVCFYCTRSGEAVFKSDNLSTVSVLKEVLSKEATKQKITVRIAHGELASNKTAILGQIF